MGGSAGADVVDNSGGYMPPLRLRMPGLMLLFGVNSTTNLGM
jgi:hypothetical protein